MPDDDLPQGFCSETLDKIKRIGSQLGVIGILHLENDVLKMCTIQETIAQGLALKLLIMNSAARHAITELDILNELVAYRIETKSFEIMVVPGEEFTAVVLQQTSLINKSNPIVDRIMEDDSVQGVIMTNDEGSPILTNMTLVTATHYGLALNRFGRMAQTYIKEIDIFNKLLTVRIKTIKNEVMLCPDHEFNIIVVQHATSKRKVVEKEKKAKTPQNN